MLHVSSYLRYISFKLEISDILTKKSTSFHSDQMPFCLSQVQSTMENGYLRRLCTLKSGKVNNIPGNNSKVRSSCYRKGENWN